MATPNVNGKFKTDEKPAYSPKFKKDILDGDLERATRLIGFGHFQENLDGLADITTGLDTKKLWKEAVTNKEIWLPLRTVVNTAFWVESNVVPHPKNVAQYDKHPEYRELDEEIIPELESQLANQRHQGFRSLMKDMARFGKVCGFAPAEKIWESENGFWKLQLKGKRPYLFNPRIDQAENLQGIYYAPKGMTFHPDAFVWAVWGPFGGDYLGVSDLTSNRHEILTLKVLQKVLPEYATILAKSPVIDIYDDASMSNDEVQKWTKSVDDTFQGKGSGVLHTPGVKNDKTNEVEGLAKLEYPDSREGAEAIKALLEITAETKKEIKRSNGLPDDLGLTTVPSGSWAKAKETVSILLSFADEVQEWTEEWITTQVIADIVEYNWPAKTRPDGYHCPIYSFERLKPEQDQETAEFIQTLTAAGYLDPSNIEDNTYVRTTLGLPEISEDQIIDSGDESEVADTDEVADESESPGFVSKVRALFKTEHSYKKPKPSVPK